MHAVTTPRQHPGRAQERPPVEQGGEKESDVLDHVDEFIAQGQVVEVGHMPHADDQRIEQRGRNRVRDDAEWHSHQPGPQHRVNHPGGQPEEETDRGRVCQELMLRHVRTEQEAFADLVER